MPFEESLCLAVLQKGIVGYTAYVCPRPAGPELDTDLVALVVDGMSLGAARRRDYDKTVLGYLGFGEERMVLRAIKNNDRVPRNIDAVRDMMLEGATGGVLFGDPACVPFAGMKNESPITLTIEEKPSSTDAGGQLLVRAKVGVQGLYLQCSDPTARRGQSMAMKVHARIPLGDRLVRDVVIDRLAIDGKCNRLAFCGPSRTTTAIASCNSRSTSRGPKWRAAASSYRCTWLPPAMRTSQSDGVVKSSIATNQAKPRCAIPLRSLGEPASPTRQAR